MTSHLPLVLHKALLFLGLSFPVIASERSQGQCVIGRPKILLNKTLGKVHHGFQRSGSHVAEARPCSYLAVCVSLGP